MAKISCKFKLFACGELVRRGRRTLRIYCEFLHFQAATVGDGSPVPNKTEPFFRNAEDGVPYKETVLILGVFKRENEVLPYGVADNFCCFPER
ncbi:MAG: hypothetical protein ACI4I3_11550 [Acutalibacteraceae bacterium]